MITIQDIANEILQDWDNNYSVEISENEDFLWVSYEGEVVIEVSDKLNITEMAKGYEDAKQQLTYMIER